MDEIDFIEQFRPAAPTTVAEVLARVAATPDRDDLAQAAADRVRADARAEQRETWAMLNRMAGNPAGEVSRCQAIVAECRERVAELEGQLETARGRLSRAGESLAHWSQTADEVHRASIQRSDPADLLAPAKQALAEQRVERMLAEVQARPAGRPKEVSRSRGGVASRSESCQWCIDQNVSDEQSYLLHSDPELNVPVTTPEQAAQWQATQAERRAYGYREAVR